MIILIASNTSSRLYFLIVLVVPGSVYECNVVGGILICFLITPFSVDTGVLVVFFNRLDSSTSPKSHRSMQSIIAIPSWFLGSSSLSFLWAGIKLKDWFIVSLLSDTIERNPLPIFILEPMKIYQYFIENIENPIDTMEKVAYSVIHKHCSPVQQYKDLKPHHKDMEQEIYGCWLEVDVDTNFDVRQVVVFAQNKGRYAIQTYLERMEHALQVPRQVSRTNNAQMVEFDYADLGWECGLEYVTTNASLESGWKSVNYPTMRIKERWIIFFLVHGFATAQVAVLCGVHRKTISRLLDKIREHAQNNHENSGDSTNSNASANGLY